MIKSAYVSTVRWLGVAAQATGLYERLERTSGRYALWARSLFAIHDIDGLIRLDLPWWTFAATDLVEGFLDRRSGARVFEYGSGASSIWLARRCRRLVSVEHDAAWHATVAERLSAYANSTLVFVPPVPAPAESRYRSNKPGWRHHDFERYVHAIDSYDDPFDLIVVDGRCRDGCLHAAVRHLAPDGVLLFDNASRRRYAACLERVPIPRIRTRGLTPCLPYPETTDLFLNDPSVLDGLAAHRG